MVDYKTRFEASFARVSADALERQFFSIFYKRFLATDPAIAAMFAKTDMENQFDMLRESLAELKNFSLSLESNNYIVTLARIHGVRGRQVMPISYDEWLDALVETVREVDPECDLQVELAWRLVLSPGITFMKFYYDR